MHTRKANVFIAGRKLGYSVEDVRKLLRNMKQKPTHAELDLERSLAYMAARELVRDNGLAGQVVVKFKRPRKGEAGGDLGPATAAAAIDYLAGMSLVLPEE